MNTLTIDDIKRILQNGNEDQLKCLSVILIPYLNNKLFSENASLLRNLSELSLRQAATNIHITGQALSQFEKKQDFPDDKKRKLFNLYLSRAVDSFINGNKQPLNAFFALFYFTLINFPLNAEIITLKEDAFKNFNNHINDDIYKKNFTDELNTVIKEIQIKRKMLFISERDAIINYFSGNIYMDTEPHLSALSKNLKNIRFILNKDQYEMSKLIGISNKTYSFYENNNLSNYTLNAYGACNIVNELFNYIRDKKSDNEILKKTIKAMFIPTNEKEHKILSDMVYDYYIAIKYGQSQRTKDYLSAELSNIEFKLEFKLPIDNETEHLDTVEPDETTFN